MPTKTPDLKPASKAKVDALWGAAEECIQNEDRANADFREAVALAAARLIEPRQDLVTYVTKTNATGYRNQVWQGQSKSRANDLIILVDTSGNEEGVADAARGRLNPQQKNGFDSVVVCEKAKSGWQIRAVVDYDHASVGTNLKANLGINFESYKVPDPSIQDALPVAEIATVPTDADLSAAAVSQHLLEAKNVILAGPPGTGKTRLALQVAETLSEAPGVIERLETLLAGRPLTDVPASEVQAPGVVWEIVQLHPSYGYEDFVRGLRTDASKSGFALHSVDGILTVMAAVAAVRAPKPTLLIIDEINRANIPSVFGETIFAIDASHRGRPVRLQYDAPKGGSDTLEIPPSLFVLGTMNTADRSIAMVDFAVRRRFRFLFVPPSSSALESYYSADSAKARAAGTLLSAINGLIADRDIHVGHSYLMTGAEDGDAWREALSDKLIHEVRPLLQEYQQEGRLNESASAVLGSMEINFLTDNKGALDLVLKALLSDEAVG